MVRPSWRSPDPDPSTCWSSAPASPGSTSSTAPGRPGFSAQLLEAGDGVGGTWFWNRYPGARFDSESYTYGYLFSKELFDEWEWQEHFAGSPRPSATSTTWSTASTCGATCASAPRSPSAVCDEPSGTWAVTTDDGTTIRARFLVAATGVLSVPYLPDIPGRDDFRGVQHHTGRWPAEPVDVAGKRVAVVGTSSSGVQVVAGHRRRGRRRSTVYQRIANWCTPLNNRPITADEQAELRAGFEQLREVLNTSIHGFHHPMNTATRLRRLARGAAGLLRGDVGQPRAS